MISAQLRKRLLMPLTLASAITFHAISALANPAFAATGVVDSVLFGHNASESKHDLNGDNSQTISGALGESARQLLPFQQPDVNGGSLTFTMQVDPLRRNYVSVKLWGEDGKSSDIGRLYLYVIKDGIEYQVGYRHEGDYMPLSVAHWLAPLPGRFFYSTTMLPYSMTRGSTSVTLKIVSTGRAYPFGSGGPTSSSPYQYAMNRPSVGIYRAYTHVDPFLNVADEKQGKEPAVTTRPSPGEEMLGATGSFRNSVNRRITSLIGKPATTRDLSKGDLRYLARAWSVPELAGYKNPAVVEKVVATLDAYATEYYADPNLATKNWGGNYGDLGQTLYLLRDALTSAQLNASVNYGRVGNKTRRTAWADMLFASREFGRLKDRRTLTNQALIANTSIYFANKGMRTLNDSRAFTENEAQRYIKEAAGMLPWSGNDLNGTHDGGQNPYGSHYYQVTSKGQTREWGYLGASYGEMQIHLAEFYDVTGNEDFRKQMIKMAKARAPFRRPAIEVSKDVNYRTMEAIGLLAWRGAVESDGEFAGFVTYADAVNVNERSRSLRVAALSKDPTLIGYAKQMLEDNQFFTNITSSSSVSAFEALDVFADYQTIKNASDNGVRLPMSEGQPDFAWADEENAVVAVKKGDERLWLTTYWQAKAGTGINGVARFHFSTPGYDQYGVLETTPTFRSTTSYTRLNRIDKPESTHYSPPNPPTNAYAGEILPLGIKPEGATSDDPSRGKADFYAARFGHYLIGINANPDSRYPLKTPIGFKGAEDLVSQRTLSGNVTVDPRSTVVLYLNDSRDAKPVPNTPLHLGSQNTNGANALFWTPSSGSQNYKVMRSTSENGTYQAIATVTDNRYSDHSGGASGRYYYRIVATNSNGESTPSMSTHP